MHDSIHRAHIHFLSFPHLLMSFSFDAHCLFVSLFLPISGLNEQSKEILFEVFDGYQEKAVASRSDTNTNENQGQFTQDEFLLIESVRYH